MDECNVGEEIPARGSLLVTDGLQQEALNRAAMRAAVQGGVGVDPGHLYRPNPAGIERTLPRRVPAQGRSDARLRVFVDALEVGDDLELSPEDIRKQRCFRGALGFQAVLPVAVGQQV